jgi:hypothetical protein
VNRGAKTIYFDLRDQPSLFPTHVFESDFWAHLGRAVATYGFLEFVLGRYVFALTATTSLPEGDLSGLVDQWLKTLKGCLADPLGGLIPRFEKALREHDSSGTDDELMLVSLLKDAKKLRDALCHASWTMADDDGRALPWFINNQLEQLETPIDAEFLTKTQKHVAELACAIVTTVTVRGIQFPGTSGRGKPIGQATSVDQ